MGNFNGVSEGYGAGTSYGIPKIVTPHTPHPSQTTAHELYEVGSIRIRFQHSTCYQ